MSGMNDYLAEAYGTSATQQPVNEDAEKVAQAEVFAKLAADNGIDLEKLDNNQIAELWNTVFVAPAEKTAGEHHGHKHKGKEAAKEHGEHGKKEEHEEKKAEAAALNEWLQTKEAQAQWQQADFAGRQMAHAYVSELRKIASDGGLDFLNETKEAKMPPQLAAALSKAKGHAGQAALGAHFVKEKVKHEAGKVKDKAKEVGGKAVEFGKAHKGHAAAAAGGAAAGAAAGYAAGHKKKASALTEAAIPVALAKVAGLEGATQESVDVAKERLAAVLTLGFNEEGTKVAAAAEFPQAKEIRALELLEAAGYSVTWDAPAEQ